MKIGKGSWEARVFGGVLLGLLLVLVSGTGRRSSPPEQPFRSAAEGKSMARLEAHIRRADMREADLAVHWGVTDPDGSEWSIQARSIQGVGGVVVPPAVRGQPLVPTHPDERGGGVFPDFEPARSPSGWGWLADQVLPAPTPGAEAESPSASTPAPVRRLQDDRDGFRTGRWFGE